MFKTRLLSGILLVIIALATIISGGYVLFFTLLAVSLIIIRTGSTLRFSFPDRNVGIVPGNESAG